MHAFSGNGKDNSQRDIKANAGRDVSGDSWLLCVVLPKCTLSSKAKGLYILSKTCCWGILSTFE